MSASEPLSPRPWDRLGTVAVALGIPVLLAAQATLTPFDASATSWVRNALLLVPLIALVALAIPEARWPQAQLLGADTMDVRGKAAAVTLCLGMAVGLGIIHATGAQPFRAGEVEPFGVLGSAVAEELIFRAAIPATFGMWLRLRWRHWLPTTASIALYVLSHLPATPAAAVYFAVVGILLTRIMHASGILVAIAAHVAFNAIVLDSGGVDIDDPGTVVIVLACLTPTLLVAQPEPTSWRSSSAPARAARSVALDTLRGIAILLIIVENLAIYDWGVGLHDWPITIWWLAMFEHMGLTVFVAAIGASIVLSGERHGPRSSTLRYRRLFVLGILDALLLFALDVLTQLALIGLLAERLLRRSTRFLLPLSALGAATIVVATQLVDLGGLVTPWGPTAMPLQPADHLFEALVAFAANLATAPLYLSLTLITAVILQRFAIGDLRRASIRGLGLGLLSAAALLGGAGMLIPERTFGADAMAVVRHGLIIVGSITLVVSTARAGRPRSSDRENSALATLGQSTLSAYLLAGLSMVAVAAVQPPGITGIVAVAAGILLAVLTAPAAARSPQGLEAFVRG